MNDATRELGAAFGIAILGSIAASRYDEPHRAVPAWPHTVERSGADSSIVGALRVANTLHGGVHGARHGVGPRVRVGCAPRGRGRRDSCRAQPVIVYRYLPKSLTADGATHGAVESLEDAATLGLGGTPPVFADATEA